MAIFLKIIGYGWIIFGAINLISYISSGQFFDVVSNQPELAGGIVILHFFLYFIPGFIIGMMGTSIERRDNL